jgi:hypothetical protein
MCVCVCYNSIKRHQLICSGLFELFNAIYFLLCSGSGEVESEIFKPAEKFSSISKLLYHTIYRSLIMSDLGISAVQDVVQRGVAISLHFFFSSLTSHRVLIQMMIMTTVHLSMRNLNLLGR